MDRTALGSLIYSSVLTGVLVLLSFLLRRLRRGRHSPPGASEVGSDCSPETVPAIGAASCDRQESETVSKPEVIKEANNGADIQPRRRVQFVVDSIFLAASYRHVSSQREEVFHYITGGQVGEATYYLAHIVPVEFSQQSVSGVQVAEASNILTLARLDAWGLPLLGHAHSHPAVGPGGTNPSGIDWRFTRRLAQGGHIAIGMVFSRAGSGQPPFVRFYADKSLDFSVEIFGNYVHQVEKNVYALEMQLADRNLPRLADAGGRSGRGWSGQPSRSGVWI